MRFPPIPAFVRQEAVQLRSQDGESYSAPIDIPRCRVDRSSQLAPNDYQLTEGSTARVFIDATEYSGDLVEGDLVRFDGEDHAVSSVARYDHPDGSPHHWEADVR